MRVRVWQQLFGVLLFLVPHISPRMCVCVVWSTAMLFCFSLGVYLPYRFVQKTTHKFLFFNVPLICFWLEKTPTRTQFLPLT